MYAQVAGEEESDGALAAQKDLDAKEAALLKLKVGRCPCCMCWAALSKLVRTKQYSALCGQCYVCVLLIRDGVTVDRHE